MNKYLKAFLESLGQFATATVGVGAGYAGLKLVPAFGTNDTINKLAPGVVAGIGAFALSTFVDNKYAKTAALGVGIAAVLAIVNNFITKDSTNPTVAKIATYIPKLGGTPTGANPGTIGAQYWMNLDHAGRPLGSLPARTLGALPARSLGNATNRAYGMNGATNKAYGLNGNRAYSLM